MKTPQELNELADRLHPGGSSAVTQPRFIDVMSAAHELRHMAQLQAKLKAWEDTFGTDDVKESVAEFDEQYKKVSQLRADLHEAAELLQHVEPTSLFNHHSWHDRRDSFLAKISTVAPETKTTKER